MVVTMLNRKTEVIKMSSRDSAETRKYTALYLEQHLLHFTVFTAVHHLGSPGVALQ